MSKISLDILFDDRTIVKDLLAEIPYQIFRDEFLNEIHFYFNDGNFFRNRRKIFSGIKSNKKMYIKFNKVIRVVKLQRKPTYAKLGFWVYTSFSDDYDSDTYIEFDLAGSTKAIENVGIKGFGNY